MCALYRFLFCLIVFVWFGIVRIALGEDVPLNSVVDGPIKDFLESRQTIRSYHLRATATSASPQVLGGKTDSFVYECWIDLDKGVVRFDRTLDFGVDKKSVPSSVTRVCVSDMDVVIQPVNRLITIGIPQVKRRGLWDPTVSGMLSYDEITRDMTVEEFVKSFVELGDKFKATVTRPPIDGIHLFTLSYRGEGWQARRQLWLDEEQDFAPVRHVTQIENGGNSLSFLDAVETNVKWASISGAILPVELNTTTWIRDNHGNEQGKVVSVLDMNWDHVNESISPALFDYMKFVDRLNEYTIIDRRSGVDVVLQSPMVPDARMLVRMNKAMAEAAGKTPQNALRENFPKQGYSTLWYLLILNGGVALIVTSVFVWRRLR